MGENMPSPRLLYPLPLIPFLSLEMLQVNHTPVPESILPSPPPSFHLKQIDV